MRTKFMEGFWGLMIKRILLAVFIVICFYPAVSAELTRIYVIVNIESAPIEILEFGKYVREDEDHIFSVVKYRNKTDRDIEALEITMIYYDAFNEKEDGVRGVSTDILKAHQSNIGGWSIYGKPSFVKTAMAFVSAVRFLDGEVWRADLEEVMKRATEMSELSFLSEAKMLEIEKK